MQYFSVYQFKITIIFLEAWNIVPQSKYSTWSQFSVCVYIPFFQHIKLPITTKFPVGIKMFSKMIAIYFLRPATQYPTLKIAQGGIFQLVSPSSLLQRIKLLISTKFHAGITFCSKTNTIFILRPGTQYPSLKIAQGGIFQHMSTFHLFQRIKLPICTKFHAGITFCSKMNTIFILRPGTQYPSLKIGQGAFSSLCLHSIFFSVSNYPSLPSFMLASHLARFM